MCVKDKNPLSYATEIIIEIKQVNIGRMASHSFIENNRRYMMFPLRDHFTIEKKNKVNGRKIIEIYKK